MVIMHICTSMRAYIYVIRNNGVQPPFSRWLICDESLKLSLATDNHGCACTQARARSHARTWRYTNCQASIPRATCPLSWYQHRPRSGSKVVFYREIFTRSSSLCAWNNAHKANKTAIDPPNPTFFNKFVESRKKTSMKLYTQGGVTGNKSHSVS